MIDISYDPALWGYIPSFLDEDDPRSAVEQIKEKYIGGWIPMKEFKLNKDTMVLSYPGDPPFIPYGILLFRDEKLFIYEGAFVVILQKDGSWEASRMD